MEERAGFDGDDATSEGIFAFEGGATELDVAAGDRVRVSGTVVERFGKTSIEVDEIRVEEEAAVADVLSLAVETALPTLESREALESMLVDIAEPLTFTESFDYEAFNQGTLAAGGPVYQYTQLNAPDVEGNAAYLDWRLRLPRARSSPMSHRERFWSRMHCRRRSPRSALRSRAEPEATTGSSCCWT